MVFVCILLLLLEYSYGFVLVDTAPRRVNQILTVGNGAPWGDWRRAEFCPDGTFANGISLKIEGKQGDGDDTALNAIRLHCGFIEHTGYGGDVTSGVGDWGVWEADYYCPQNEGMLQFLDSFVMQVEASQGGNGDDTAANYAKFKCRNFDGNSTENIIPLQDSGIWGNYGSWSESCHNFSAICGIQTRVEHSLGGGADDTALNDTKLFCCDE